MTSTVKEFKYPFWISLLYVMPSLFMTLVGAILLGLASLDLADMLLPVNVNILPSMSRNLLSLLIAGSLGLLSGLAGLTLHAHLYVTPIGLKVIYCGVPISVPWADVVELTVFPLTSQPPWQIIRVKRLSIFHRLLGHMFGARFDPIIAFNYGIKGYSELIEIIESHIFHRE